MNREDIVRMAQEAGLVNWEATAYANELSDFAKLVAEDERRFCIQFLMELHGAQMGNNNLYQYAAQALSELNGRELPNKFSLNIRNNQ